MSPQIEIFLISMLIASACAIPGTFLILRGMALMSDAISHSILLGIVIFFFIVKNLYSPWLLFGATLAGMLTVSLTEILIRSQRIKKDAAIGLVFPMFFSIAVILINQFAGHVHLDSDAVLLGELAFAPFNRLIIAGADWGPVALWTASGILLLNILFASIFYKELKLATFDNGLAVTLGFSPWLIHYLLMGITSLTAVGSFDAVGSILVVALMITPPAAAYLLTNRLSYMLFTSIGLGALSAITGYLAAQSLDITIAGSMATCSGIIFLIIFLIAPQKGLLTKIWHLRQQRVNFAIDMLLVQLITHENSHSENKENTIQNMVEHMQWPQRFANLVARKAAQRRLLTRHLNHMTLTPLGRETAKEVILQ